MLQVGGGKESRIVKYGAGNFEGHTVLAHIRVRLYLVPFELKRPPVHNSLSHTMLQEGSRGVPLFSAHAGLYRPGFCVGAGWEETGTRFRPEPAEVRLVYARTHRGAMFGTLIATLVAVVFLAIAAWMIRAARARRGWPAIRGVVTGGGIRQRTSGVGEEESVIFVPVVEFQYEVGSKTYAASGPGFNETGYGSRSRAENVLARYPAGAAVEVHYNPAKPGEAFLESSNTLAWIMLGVGCALLAVAVVLGIYGG